MCVAEVSPGFRQGFASHVGRSRRKRSPSPSASDELVPSLLSDSCDSKSNLSSGSSDSKSGKSDGSVPAHFVPRGRSRKGDGERRLSRAGRKTLSLKQAEAVMA